jgi:hypothetical protein
MSRLHRLWIVLAFALIAGAEPANWAGRHRNLFNGDCTFLFGDVFVKDPKAKYEKETLHRFIDLLAMSGVDTYLCNPNAQVPWYPSKRTPHILTGYQRGNREFFRGHFRPGLPKERLDPVLDDQVLFLNRYLDLAEAGLDWVAEIAKACRHRGVSPWVSVRMNDMHGANSWEKSYMNCALQRDPRFRLSGKQADPKESVNRMEQSLNFAKKEVRNYMLLVIRELVEDYDFEGLELDWLRCPFCIDPPATPEQIETMTRWHAEVRELCQTKAKKTGKPFPLGVRIPIRLGQLKEIGLDIPALAKSGVLDFVNVSNFWQTSWDVPYEELRRDLGPGVAIYGVIEDAPNAMNAFDPKTGHKGYRLLSASPELLRGNAAGKLVLDVQGIETFNFFCTDEVGHNPLWKEGLARYPALKNLHDLAFLRGKPKHYTLASSPGVYAFPLWEFAEQLPAVLEPDSKKAFRLSMCREPDNMDLGVQIVVERQDAVPHLGVSVNGSYPNFAVTETDRLIFPTGIFTHHAPEHRALEFRLKAAQIREGWNEILVFNGSRKNKTPAERREHSVRVVSVELGVRNR